MTSVRSVYSNMESGHLFDYYGPRICVEDTWGQENLSQKSLSNFKCIEHPKDFRFGSPSHDEASMG